MPAGRTAAKNSMYKLKLTRREKQQLFRVRWLILAGCLIGVGLIVWMVWIRPAQSQSNIKTFEACVRAGNPVQESYPEVCLTKDGKRFVNPEQDQAHQRSQTTDEILTPPSNPDLLILHIDEWKVSVPLTVQTFDLGYTYIENGGEEYLLFTYKRLVQKDLCTGDIGLRLSRSLVENQQPFTPNKPAPVAKVDKYYYYITYVGPECYDSKNADHVALVAPVAGDKNLKQVTADLLAKLIATPE